MTATPHNDDLEIGHDFQITRTERQAAGNGTWVCGQLNGHRFNALVFPQHADNSQWEQPPDSRISKLWVQRLADRVTVFNWDRGEDIDATDAIAEAIVDFLTAGLAESVFGK